MSIQEPTVSYVGLRSAESEYNIDDNSSENSSLTEYENDRLRTGTSWFAAVFLVVNAALGAGLLNFPEAYNQAGGIVVAITVQAVLVAFVIASLIILAFCSDFNESSTYQDVVLGLCGKSAQQICSVGVILYCYGTCITFLIIIGDQFDRVFASLYGSDFCNWWYMNRNFTVVASSTFLILPLCFPRRIDFLKYSSSVGVFAIFYVVFLIMYQFYTETYPKGKIKTSPDAWTDIFNVVPVICFGYQCHISVVPIYSCLKERSITLFSRTVFLAILLCMITYTIAGTFGYFTFGSLVPSDVLEAYNATEPIVLIGIIALALKTFTTYPILQFCGRVAIDNIFVELRRYTPDAVARGELRRRVIISLVWFASSIALAIIIPTIGSVIQILGSLAAIFIFVFPGLCWIQATYKKDPTLVLRKDKTIILFGCAFIVIGFFIFGVVLTQAIQNDIKGSNTQESLCKPS